MIFVEARPSAYVTFDHKLIKILESCMHVEKVLLIDEMVFKLTVSQQVPKIAIKLAAKIKRAIAKQFDYIRGSIGIAPNTFLVKIASNIQKLDGCIMIQQHELLQRLYGLKLRALNGIGKLMEACFKSLKSPRLSSFMQLIANSCSLHVVV